MKNISLFILSVITCNLVFSQETNGADESPEKRIAICNYYLENYGAAIKGLTKEFVKDSTDPDIAYMLGNSYVNLELYKKAVSFYNKAVEMDATKNVWAYELGLLYYNLNDFKKAVIFFRQAIAEGYPENNDFSENLGYALIYSGELYKGEKLLLDIFYRKPANKGVLRDLAEAYYDHKLYDKSLKYCQKLLDLDVKDAKALYQAGLCLKMRGQKNSGKRLCEKAIRIDPSLAIMFQKECPQAYKICIYTIKDFPLKYILF